MTLRELGRWPLNSDLVEYASTALRGQLVLASNDDVYPEGDAWLLPPPTALMLSRWAKRVETCDGCARRECNAVARTPANSVCSRANVGSFDAWLHRFDAPVTAETQPAALAMLRTPRHSLAPTTCSATSSRSTCASAAQPLPRLPAVPPALPPHHVGRAQRPVVGKPARLRRGLQDGAAQPRRHGEARDAPRPAAALLGRGTQNRAEAVAAGVRQVRGASLCCYGKILLLAQV